MTTGTETTTQDMTAAELRAWREGLGWSRADLARWYGVTSRAVSHYESGTRPVPRPLAQRIRDELDAEGAGQTS